LKQEARVLFLLPAGIDKGRLIAQCGSVNIQSAKRHIPDEGL